MTYPAPQPAPAGGLGEALRRFSTLVVLAVVLSAGAAAALSFQSQPRYEADGFYVVPPGSGTVSPEALTPFDAERIARTYAVVLAEDAELLEALAAPLGIDAARLSDRITAVPLPNSSAVRVTYSGTSEAQVELFFSTLTSLVQGSSPPSDNLRPGTLRVLQDADEVTETGGGSWAAPVAGGLAGLLLGLGAASMLTRNRPLVRRGEDLREAGASGVLDLHADDQHSTGALAVRMLNGLQPGAWVAVVGATSAAAADAMVEQLKERTAGLVREQALEPTAESTFWLAASLETGRGERAAQDADRTLLLVPTDAPLRDVSARLAGLRDLGVDDVVVAVLQPARKRKAQASEGLSPFGAALAGVARPEDDVRSAT